MMKRIMLLILTSLLLLIVRPPELFAQPPTPARPGAARSLQPLPAPAYGQIDELTTSPAPALGSSQPQSLPPEPMGPIPPSQPGPIGAAPTPPPGAPPPVPLPYTTASITGTVRQYLLTPVGDVEGLELEDGTDVRFPPHLGMALAAVAKRGDRVNAVGFLAPPTRYGRALRAVTITNVTTNQAVVDQPPAAPSPPPWTRQANLTRMTVAGRLDHYVLNDHDDIDGLILDNGDEVKFAPPVGSLVANAIAVRPKTTIRASGYGISSAFGTVVDAMSGSLTVGSQAIAVGGPPQPF